MVAEDTKYSLKWNKKKEHNWTIKKLEHCIVGRLSNLTMHLRISVCIFTKQPEQSWLHKALNVLTNEGKKKKGNIIGPTIKKCEYCIVGR